jgi:hypothetical protein
MPSQLGRDQPGASVDPSAFEREKERRRAVNTLAQIKKFINRTFLYPAFRILVRFLMFQHVINLLTGYGRIEQPGQHAAN